MMELGIGIQEPSEQSMEHFLRRGLSSKVKQEGFRRSPVELQNHHLKVGVVYGILLFFYL